MDYDLHQCITLSLSDLKKNEPMLIAASYIWLNSTNTFMFAHGPMTFTLADILMLTGLKITGSINRHEFLASGKKLAKISEISSWTKYIASFAKTSHAVDDKEHVAFLNM